MGEAVISGGSGLEQLENKNNDGKAVMETGGGEAASSPSVVMWERFLPKTVLRVLLVEADDSTRQIIAALLRKCSYRVAAVTDGLKAWEVLRARPCSIDLILTEVDLPLISGYALLTLIMENEACKNIPVIMMSSHDSVSTVYKCMLRGATDFLVKPVRKNELRNLWQHVWRKQASSIAAGLGPPEESTGQKKDEATAENNAVSDDNSSQCVACVPRSKEGIEKGSDAQSSCTKLESRNNGDEDDDAGNLHEHSQPDANPIESRIHGKNSHEDKVEEPVNLIGAFDDHPNVATGVSASTIISKDVEQHLDLSLQRSRPDGSTNHAIPERDQLNHSEASPFSRYVNKPVQLGSSSLMHTQTQHNDREIFPENCAPSYYIKYSTEMHIPTTQSQKHPVREISHPIPVRGVIYENSQAEKDPCHVPSECQPSCSVQVHGYLDRRNSGSGDHTDKKPDKMGIENPVSVGNSHNGSANFCNGNINSAPSECGNNETDDGARQRSLLREAALLKFRLKRKERCFGKKVRYESRKKLAEQRPRVKGQFVRQVPNDPQPWNGTS